MTSWSSQQFKELFRFPLSSGLTKPKRVRGTGVKMVNMGELFAYDRIDNPPMEKVPLTESESKSYLLEEGDLLFARQSLVAEGAGKCSIMLSVLEDTTFEGHLIRCRLDNEKAEPLFYYYFFRSPQGKASISSIVEQVAAAGIRGSDLSRLEVPVPPLDVQISIAHILGALDDKIELNRQMNKTLEAIARTIFNSWFVDFEPIPGIRPHKEWEDSPLGRIPKGWQVAELRSRATHVEYGLTRSASTKRVGPKFLRITDIRGGTIDWGSVPFVSASQAEHGRYRLKKGDVVVARTGASTGENAYIAEDVDAVYASYLVRLRFRDVSISRVASLFMRSPMYFDYVQGVIGGSAQPNASAQVLSAAQCVFPSLSIADAFYKIVEPLDELRMCHDRQSSALSEMRNTLLPRLLSGEIRIRDAERIVGEKV